MGVLTPSQRVLIVKYGCADREESVKKAATALLGKWAALGSGREGGEQIDGQEAVHEVGLHTRLGFFPRAIIDVRPLVCSSRPCLTLWATSRRQSWPFRPSLGRARTSRCSCNSRIHTGMSSRPSLRLSHDCTLRTARPPM